MKTDIEIVIPVHFFFETLKILVSRTKKSKHLRYYKYLRSRASDVNNSDFYGGQRRENSNN